MRKKYTYDNADIYITIPKGCIHNIKNATEHFLKNVVKEKQENGNSNKTGDIAEQ